MVCQSNSTMVFGLRCARYVLCSRRAETLNKPGSAFRKLPETYQGRHAGGGWGGVVSERADLFDFFFGRLKVRN